jgi:hypothetical protein
MACEMRNLNELSDEYVVEGRLRHFINKYYRVKIFQGLVITVSAALILVLTLVVLGNVLPVSDTLHNLFSIAGVIMVAVVLAVFVLKPIAQRIGLIKGLNFREASEIIREKHKSVEDRIINIIELTREREGKNNKLYDYAIAQKTDNVREINFNDAISLRNLALFAARLLALAVIAVVTVVLWPDFVKRGIGAMWSGNEQIAELRKISFVILNDSLSVESGQDFLLRFEVKSGLPVENVRLMLGSSEENVEQAKDGYEYLFRAVNASVSFRLSASGMISEEFILGILKKPGVSGLQLTIVPPGYTALERSVTEGNGNAEVASGSRIFWKIRTVNTDAVFMIHNLDTILLEEKSNSWNYEKVISENMDYELFCKNSNGLTINYFYRINVVRDLYPTVDISESHDSTALSEVFVQGIIQDDYGFSKLEVVANRDGNESVTEIAIKKSRIYDNFYYTLVADSNNVEYYFRIWDNDYISGPKFSESRKISMKTRSVEELEDLNNALADSIKSTMLEGMDAIEKLERKISEFRMEQVVGDLKPWEVQERIKELNELKSEVLDLLKNISETDKEFTENENLLDRDEELAEKAEQIRELMENLLDEELKELLKQFEELAKEFNAKKADDLTEKLEMNLEKLKEQMDMSLELLKKYDMEKDLIRQVEELNEMADSLQTENAENQDDVNKLKEDFKKWEEEFEKTLKEDKELKKPMGLDSLNEDREEVREAAEEMDKKDPSGSPSEKKSNAKKALKKLAGKMQEMLGIMNGEGESVDLEDVRQIRNSLNDFSKKQEELNGRVVKINTNNPTFTAVIREQKALQEKFAGVRDSLKSIGYKQPVIAKIIGEELFHVETSMKNLFESYAANRANTVRVEQNKIMTEVNSIAVKLDELISSMENAKGSGTSQGSQAFTDRKKPNKGDQKGSEKLGETKSQQQSMKEQLKSAIQKMKSGANGKKERGELARMLGEREMMRKSFEKLLQEGGLGTEAREKANEALKMMKEVEKDIIYNRMGDQTLRKDEMIRTRLLEAENAEKERETENRRESKEFRGSYEPNRKEIQLQEDQTRNLEQMLKYNELKLKKFYQEKYLKYIESTKK